MSMEGHAARSETRRYGRSAFQLGAALGLAGALTYVFFGLASHSLGADEYGEVVILWSAVLLVAATLFRPIEHLLARTLAERHGTGQRDADAFRPAAIIQLGLCAFAGVAVLAAKAPIQDNLFSDEPGLYWAMLGALLGYSLAYFARGLLAGRGQFGLYAALLLSEVLIRLAAAVFVAVGVMNGTLPIAVGIALAPLTALVVLPLAIRRGAAGGGPERPAGASGELTLGTGGAFTGAVLVMMLTEQVLINSGALFVRADNGAAGAGFIFNMMMVARAPLVLFLAVAASLLPHLARLRARGDESSARAFRSSLATTLTAVAVFATATLIGLLAIGPQVMQLAFGDRFDYDRVGLAIVAVGMGLYLTAVSINQAILAHGRAVRAAVPWLGSGLLFVVLNVWQPFSSYRTVEIGFAVSAGVLAGGLYLVYAFAERTGRQPVSPDSAAEIEAKIAAIDEVA
jgi:O-antigen/teichoic acid export membrane protein